MRALMLGLWAAATFAAAIAQGYAQGRLPAGARERYRSCVEQARTDPAAAIAAAGQWRDGGGGLPARHCLALALIAQERFGPAAATLEQAATAAQAARDPSAADLWGQAGNAALLGGDTARADAAFTYALALAADRPPMRAQLLIDRARTRVEAGRNADARADLDEAVKLLPTEPVAWLLRGTLARRMGNVAAARSDIATAAGLDPRSPDVLLEQGNLAALGGQPAEARRFWERAAQEAPQSPAAAIARRALTANGIVEEPTAAPARP